MRKLLCRTGLVALILLLCAVIAVGEDSASLPSLGDQSPAATGPPASEVPPHQEFSRALGGFRGPFSGTGLHYHKWVRDNGFHINFGVIYVPLTANDTWYSTGNTLDYAVGGEFQHRVYGDVFSSWLEGSLYVFASGMHRGYIPVVTVVEGYLTNPDDPNTWVEPVLEQGAYTIELGGGVGIGVELILFRHFSFPIEFGYGANWSIDTQTTYNWLSVGPNLQGGIRYRY